MVCPAVVSTSGSALRSPEASRSGHLHVSAQFECSSIVEPIAAGMERKAKSGGWTVGTYPFGYRKLDGTPGLSPDPAAAPQPEETRLMSVIADRAAASASQRVAGRIA